MTTQIPNAMLYIRSCVGDDARWILMGALFSRETPERSMPLRRADTAGVVSMR
jgi:hypothetical protein